MDRPLRRWPWPFINDGDRMLYILRLTADELETLLFDIMAENERPELRQMRDGWIEQVTKQGWEAF